MFSQACVILFTGGCLSQCMLGCHTPPWEQTPPGTRYTHQSRHPLGADPLDQVQPPMQSMLGDTVNARAVRILLECNLVEYFIHFVRTKLSIFLQLFCIQQSPFVHVPKRHTRHKVVWFDHSIQYNPHWHVHGTIFG